MIAIGEGGGVGWGEIGKGDREKKKKLSQESVCSHRPVQQNQKQLAFAFFSQSFVLPYPHLQKVEIFLLPISFNDATKPNAMGGMWPIF